MPLIERDNFLSTLQEIHQATMDGEGHCVFVKGDAGIGKTALVRSFCKQQAGRCKVFQAACDGLFTPRPLGPVYDALWQLRKDSSGEVAPDERDRSLLFGRFLRELIGLQQPFILVFEDIHWADEGTLDFIKFLGRRIDQVAGLFVLTYRDTDIHQKHPLRDVLSQLQPDSFTKLTLEPLSKEAVIALAAAKGYNGEDVYRVSGGIPFYVKEILASYSPGVPDNIKDAVLAVYDKLDEGTRNAWELFSVIPEGLELDRFRTLKQTLNAALNHCFNIAVIIVQNDKVIFKHELYRRTIEESLTLFRRMEVNKIILDLFLDSFEERGEIERILHYAKHADERELIRKYAPLAARNAAAAGAHRQAARLFLTAIGDAGDDVAERLSLYEAYAYECYLSNQIGEAIAYTEKALGLWELEANIEKIGASLQFLSRLWWFAGNRKNAEEFGWRAIDVLRDQAASSTKAMSFSNISQLKMLSEETEECMKWGEMAIAMAASLQNNQIVAHALNNVGSVEMLQAGEGGDGIARLRESLQISLSNNYDEHAARAYTNLGSGFVKKRMYKEASGILETGIQFCEQKDLDSWTNYMLSWKARLLFETGKWSAAEDIARRLYNHFNQPPITKITIITVLARINMRKGENDAVDLLSEARSLAFDTMELQRLTPVVIAMLEYEWLTGSNCAQQQDIVNTLHLMKQNGGHPDNREVAFWLQKAGRTNGEVSSVTHPFDTRTKEAVASAGTYWEQTGCPYEQALLLAEGDEDSRKKAISILLDLGATVVTEKIKQELRSLGIRNIPRGARNSTRSNVASLTTREMDILQLLQERLANREIAARLYISPKTVDHHISSILFKLDAGTRAGAVEAGLRLGLIK